MRARCNETWAMDLLDGICSFLEWDGMDERRGWSMVDGTERSAKD
jgi:hypothetical protein